MQENLNQEIVKKTQDEVFSISRKVLAELASVSLEQESTNLFIKRLNELKDDEKKKFIDAFKADPNPVLVQSAFVLPAQQQTDIQKSVKDILGGETQFKFSVSPGIISGIELSANGFKVAWSISEYLNSLERSINETIKEKAKPEAEKKTDAGKKAETETEVGLAAKEVPVKTEEPVAKAVPEKETEAKAEPQKK